MRLVVTEPFSKGWELRLDRTTSYFASSLFLLCILNFTKPHSIDRLERKVKTDGFSLFWYESHQKKKVFFGMPVLFIYIIYEIWARDGFSMNRDGLKANQSKHSLAVTNFTGKYSF